MISIDHDLRESRSIVIRNSLYVLSFNNVSVRIDYLKNAYYQPMITELPIDRIDRHEFSLTAIYDRFILISGGVNRLASNKKESAVCLLLDTESECMFHIP